MIVWKGPDYFGFYYTHHAGRRLNVKMGINVKRGNFWLSYVDGNLLLGTKTSREAAQQACIARAEALATQGEAAE